MYCMILMSILGPLTRLASRSLNQNLLTKRQISFRKIVASVLGTGNTEEANTATINKMATTMEELKAENQKLQYRIRFLVSQLEEQKKQGEYKLTPDQVIKPREEQEAVAAMEKLKIKPKAETASTTASQQAPVVPKKGEPKVAKPRGGKAAEAKEPEKPLDVSRLDLRIGKIVEVDKHPDADALYLEKIDCGDSTGPRTVISGLVNHVPIEQMRDRLVVVLCNLKPAKMRGILSEAMVMCASTPEKVELLGVPEGVKPGDRVVFEKYPGEPDAQLNPKKKIWEQVAPEIKTNDEGVAMYKDCPFKVLSIEGAFKSNLKNVQIR